MQSLPVSWISRDGSRTLEGVLALDAGSLLLQYQTRDWHQGAQRSTARELRLAADSIVLATYSAGALWSFPRIEIQSSDFTALAGLDADQSGHLRFRIRGNQRRAAKALLQELNSAMAESRFSRWTRDLDRLAPPPAGDDGKAPPAAG
jgi:hypothetical protein